jgi:glycosyltransferase involved in cell wall biosynthesis
MPTISIIIPNKNYERFLRDALDSVKHQTFRDWECIIVDDASVDNSCDIIQEYVDSDKRFKLIKMKEHAGISAVRNAGLDAATGEYVAFLDADDAYAQNALETLYVTAKMTGADIVNGFAQNVDESFRFYPSESATFVPCGFSTYNQHGLYLAHGVPNQQ